MLILFQIITSWLMVVFYQMGPRWYCLLKFKLAKNTLVRLINNSKIHLMASILSKEILKAQMYLWFIQEPIEELTPCF
jgi:hypothetical protein